MSEVFKVIGEMLEGMIDAAKKGVSDEDILARIAEPGGVGEKLLAAIKKRKSKFDDYIQNG